ncbi:hypothetical protein LWI29_021706 [Acer saccharum]|uniref:Uncharacterized protein n=1 Tax=Acer saccharum TaxID=4024 RepID=A0AA39VR28_ACESA|nr:hypothetical protein LWI29_021706 [Acer saccharum]
MPGPSLHSRPLQDDIKDSPASPDDDLADWEEFGDSETKPDENLDPGSWSPIFEPGMDPDEPYQGYYSTVSKMMAAASAGESRVRKKRSRRSRRCRAAAIRTPGRCWRSCMGWG